MFSREAEPPYLCLSTQFLIYIYFPDSCRFLDSTGISIVINVDRQTDRGTDIATEKIYYKLFDHTITEAEKSHTCPLPAGDSRKPAI